MAIIQLILSLIILGILYVRMIRRETPAPIGKPQAIVPVILGVVSVFGSFFVFLQIGAVLLKLGYSGEKLHPVLRSCIAAFVGAGLPEEITKLVMILITILIFRSRIRNVYEYILIGAAVGFGFTLFEEFLYGSGGLSAIMRLVTVACHMIFGIIMGRHLGLGRNNKKTGRGSVAGEYVKAVLFPILIHTIYDACNGTNYYLRSENETEQAIGIAIGLGAMVIMFVFQIMALIRLKKDTENYCRMEL